MKKGEKHFRARKRGTATPAGGADATRRHIFFHPDCDGTRRRGKAAALDAAEPSALASHQIC